jgi:hypothetical protein
MPESFDTLLAEIAESAGWAVHPAGAAAARQRGHQRAVRRRFAATILSVVLLGGVGGLALALATLHSGVRTPVTHTPPTVTGDLDTIVPSAWTAVSQFPYSGLRWKAKKNQPVIHTSDRPWFYSCYGDGATLTHLGASGYQEISYEATAQGVQDVDAADQVMFFFPSTHAAQEGLATIRQDYAQCAVETYGTADATTITGVVSQTAELDGSYAWSHLLQRAGFQPVGGDVTLKPGDVPDTNHEFFVQRGDVIEMVWFGGEGSLANQVEDRAFLKSLSADMCVYGGKCPG